MMMMMMNRFVSLDEPGPPGRPEATDWDKDHIDLRWTPPLNDGGSPITGYIIEKREKDGPRWIKACETGPECKGRVDNLDEGVEYEFRVKAVNIAGPGEPSDTSKPITAKSRRCKNIFFFLMVFEARSYLLYFCKMTFQHLFLSVAYRVSEFTSLFLYFRK